MKIFLLLFLSIAFTEGRRSSPPLFIHPTETQDLNCASFMQQTVLNKEGTNRNEDMAEYRQTRVTYPDTEDWNSFKMDCESIFTRTYYQLDEIYPEEKEFPLAFSRIVYKDYRMVEMELASTYAPQNHYCYALDANSSPMFHARMKSLVNCFPNVYLASTEFIMDAAGHNISQSEFECLKLLANPSYKWNYVISMQNHDVALKTNQELIQVFQWLNGTNDLDMMIVPEERVNKNADWSFDALKLFKNETKNHIGAYNLEPKMTIAKSFSTASLSRAAVDFFVNELELEPFMKSLEWREFGTNELFLGSLNTADALALPGGFTVRCLEEKLPDYFVSRFTIWKDQDTCATEIWRNDMCVFGMEHLSEFIYSRYLFANKFQPDKDFGAVACWHEYMFNRTHLERGTMRLDPTHYTSPPHVRFNRERNQKGSEFNPRYFDCNSASKKNIIFSIFIVFFAFRGF
ncbi:hypothetical protein M3Y97_00313500 [Aphelenchoides bicaudatus]|nr:hypothetical protein M3Y97_00313500 [Aphelenchoides bicaudatus]